jgi:hypothetical protein
MMGSTFAIFKIAPDGPLWLEAVQGLREAEERMDRLALTGPGQYFIHSPSKGIVALARETIVRRRCHSAAREGSFCMAATPGREVEPGCAGRALPRLYPFQETS